MSEICRHFGVCGGCAYQDMPDDAYRTLKRSMIADAMARHGFADCAIDDIAEVGPFMRRRASFKAAKRDGRALLGFHAAASHDIVDMHDCRVITPSLFALVPGLRAMMAALLDEGEKAELFVTETDSGADVNIVWRRGASRAIAAQAAQWAARLKVARLSANGELLAELSEPLVSIGKARVRLPVTSFMQPTLAGESFLQSDVVKSLKGAAAIADLFCGLGTFALVLAEQSRVHAIDDDGSALEALQAGARGVSGQKPVTIERRNLFKLPLSAQELARFDAVVLDPPRIGAQAQAKALSASKVRRIAYVSCNPVTFARDARTLVDGGYRMGTLHPVDQFLWSSHIELVTAFVRT